MSSIDEAVDAIRARKPRQVVFMTGAGVSADSGIPTFRGPGGLWRDFRPEELATPAAFRRDPKLVREWYEWRRGLIREARPNAAHEAIARIVEDLDALPRVVIVRLRNMTAIDATGLRALEELADRIRASGRVAIFCGAREQPRAAMEQAGLPDRVGRPNFCPHVDAALDRAREIVGSAV